ATLNALCARRFDAEDQPENLKDVFQALSILESAPDATREETASVKCNLASFYLNAGRRAEAARILSETVPVLQRLNAWKKVALADDLFAEMALMEGNAQKGKDYFCRAAAAYMQARDLSDARTSLRYAAHLASKEPGTRDAWDLNTRVLELDKPGNIVLNLAD